MPCNAFLTYFPLLTVLECKTRPRNDIMYRTGSGVGVRQMHVSTAPDENHSTGRNISHHNLSQSVEPFYLHAWPKAMHPISETT